MTAAERVLNTARGELGYKESPANSNLTKYGKWYGLNGNPWCMMFVYWVFHQAGEVSLLPSRTASCTQFMTRAKASGQWVTSGYQPGDVVLFDFDGKRATSEHVGIVESAGKSYLNTIEGNTAIGNDDNGGAVMRRSRKLSVVLGAYRPKYPAAKPIEEVAREVLDGKWGNGETRKARLTAAGYDPAEVQKRVNALVAEQSAKKSLDVMAAECADGIHGNGLVRQAKLALLGYTAAERAEIQRRVNALVKG